MVGGFAHKCPASSATPGLFVIRHTVNFSLLFSAFNHIHIIIYLNVCVLYVC